MRRHLGKALLAATLVTLAACGEDGASLTLRISGPGGMAFKQLKGWAVVVDAAPSPGTWTFAEARVLADDPYTVRLDVEGGRTVLTASLLVLGYHGAGTAYSIATPAASWIGRVDLTSGETVLVTLSALVAGRCDKDADGFPNSDEPGCCESEERQAFADCRDWDATAFPYDPVACERCPRGCEGMELEVTDVDVSSAESDNPEAVLVDNGDGTVTDTKTTLVWQKTPPSSIWDHAAAEAYCVSGGYSSLPGMNWRLPTISQLRSIVKGCTAAATGGTCNVSDGGCLDWNCRDSSCDGCPYGGGPGENEYYVDEIMDNSGHNWFWSSSFHADFPAYAWFIAFDSGYVSFVGVQSSYGVRCVRSLP